MQTLDIVGITTAVGAAVGALVAVIPIRTHLKEEKKQRGRVQDAILGVHSDQGLPSHPSIFDQIASLQLSVNEIADLTKQLRPNGGSSLADEIRRSAHKLDQVQEKIDAQVAQFVNHLEAHADAKALTSTSTARRVSTRVRKSPTGEQKPKEGDK